MSGKQVELKVRYYLVLDAPPRLWHLVQIVSQSGVIIPPVTPVAEQLKLLVVIKLTVFSRPNLVGMVNNYPM